MKIEPHSKPALKRSLYALMLPEKDLILGGVPGDAVIMPSLSTFDRQLMMLLDGSLTVREIAQKLNANNIACEEREILEALRGFDEQLLLEDYAIESAALAERYNRQALFFAAMKQRGLSYATQIQERIQHSHIVLFGLGGFGSHLLYEFSAMGIGKLTLVDYDNVEESNLNRQILYNEADVGRSKIDSAKEKSLLLNSSIKYEFIEKKIASSDDVYRMMIGADLAVLAADNPREKIFKWLNHASYQSLVPALFSLGSSQDSIRIGPLVVPGKTACFNCSMPDLDLISDDTLVQSINRRHHHGIIIPHIMIAAGIMGVEITKHLTGYEDCRLYNNRILLNVNTFGIEFQKILPRKTCKYCSSHDIRGED